MEVNEMDYQDRNKNIQIMAGSRINEIRAEGKRWFMHELGTATFDDGEAQSPEHIQNETALYYQNDIPEKTKAFVKEIKTKYPDVDISLSSLGPEDGDDMSRFQTDLNLDMDDLESPQDDLNR